MMTHPGRKNTRNSNIMTAKTRRATKKWQMSRKVTRVETARWKATMTWVIQETITRIIVDTNETARTMRTNRTTISVTTTRKMTRVTRTMMSAAKRTSGTMTREI